MHYNPLTIAATTNTPLNSIAAKEENGLTIDASGYIAAKPNTGYVIKFPSSVISPAANASGYVGNIGVFFANASYAVLDSVFQSNMTDGNTTYIHSETIALVTPPNTAFFRLVIYSPVSRTFTWAYPSRSGMAQIIECGG
ncbi:MAG: hypothetical protein LBG83_04285 [Oscillospiraceae bacterium]|nr:hypothetical protein [Oscillospiraceae bacterium]